MENSIVPTSDCDIMRTVPLQNGCSHQFTWVHSYTTTLVLYQEILHEITHSDLKSLCQGCHCDRNTTPQAYRIEKFNFYTLQHLHPTVETSEDCLEYLTLSSVAQCGNARQVQKNMHHNFIWIHVYSMMT